MPVRRQALICAAIVATAVAVVAMPAFGGTEAKRSTTNVTVADDYYSLQQVHRDRPVKLKVKKNAEGEVGLVVERTPTPTTSSSPASTRRASSRRTSRSGDLLRGRKFKPKFKVPGTYGFVCTYHKSVMKMDVKVKK